MIDIETFQGLLRKFLKYPEFTLEHESELLLKDLGLDSVTAINLLFEIEDEFDLTIDDEYLTEATFKTAHSLLSTLTSIKSAQTV